MLRSTSDPTQFPSSPPQSIQGVPPLTGDGLQFDAPLDHADPSPPLDRPTPLPSGGRAFGVIAALIIGLLAGFAGGFVIGQQGASIPAPRSAAVAVAPVPTTAAPTTAVQPQTYTDAPVAEEIRDSAPVVSETPLVSKSNVGRASPKALSGEGGSGPTSLTAPNRPGSLQIASRPVGAQVFVDDVRVGVAPMSLADVSAGTHRVRMELPGFRRWATTVTVESGTRARVGASLER